MKKSKKNNQEYTEKFFKRILIVGLVMVGIASLFFSVHQADASIINVPSDYPTIQDAVDNATTGDIINVSAGTYNESVVVATGIVLRGAQADIDPRGGAWTGGTSIINPGAGNTGIDIRATSVTVNGFEILGGAYGIYVGPTSTNVTHVDIIYNYLHNNTKYGCQLIDLVAGLNVDHVNISMNYFTYNGRNGLKMVDVMDNLVTSNEFCYNGYGSAATQPEYQFGIFLEDERYNGAIYAPAINNTFTCNSFHDNKLGAINMEVMGLTSGSYWASTIFLENTTVHHNNFYGNSSIWGIKVSDDYNDDGSQDGFGPIALINATCNWWNNTGGPTHATYPSGSGVLVSDNVTFCPWLTGSYPGGCCCGYVAHNLDTDEWFGTIQQAIDDPDTLDGHTIQVSAGTHTERLIITKSLTLQGAGAGQTIIDITGLSVPNPNIAVEILNGVDNVTLDGFTIIGSSTSSHADDSVIRCGGSSGICNDITITNNTLNGYLGILFKNGARLNIWSNTFTVNKNGIITQTGCSDIEIVGNVISPGSSMAYDPAGIYITSTSGVIKENIISGIIGPSNRGKGIHGSNNADLMICRNTIMGSGYDGISFWGNTHHIQIRYNNLSGNGATRPGCGIKIKGNNITIQGNNLFNNSDTGVTIDTHTVNTEAVSIHYNNIVGNGNYGLEVANTHETVNAVSNWWGDASGPYNATYNPTGVGDNVTGDAIYDSWLAAAIYPAGVSVGPVQNLDTGEWFCSIQAAIDDPDTLDGHTINVYAGIYEESINLGAEQSGGLNFIGEDQTTTFWKAKNNPANLPCLERDNRNNNLDYHMELSGFTFIGDGNDSSLVHIFKNQYGTGTGELYLNIHDNTFVSPSNYTGTLANYGLWVCKNNQGRNIDGTYRVKIHNNTFKTISGICMSGCTNFSIYNNDFTYDIVGNGVFNRKNTILYMGSCCGSGPDAAGGHYIHDNDFAHVGDGYIDNIANISSYNNVSEYMASPRAAIYVLEGYDPGTRTYMPDYIEANTFDNPEGGGICYTYYDTAAPTYTGITINGQSYTQHTVKYTNFASNIIGVFSEANQGVYIPVDARCNWWGNANGPGGNGPGTGDNVSTNVTYCPWLNAAYPGGSCSGGGVVHNLDTDEWFCSIQAAIDDPDTLDGHTIQVIAGNHAGAIVNKSLEIIGDVGGGTIITSGVHYGGGHPTAQTAFRLDAGADGTEIKCFTIQCNPAASFYFGVFSRNIDDVVLDSFVINNTVQGITNWGGNYWEITNNQIYNTTAAGGGGIAILLGVTPNNANINCSGNLVENNTIMGAASATTYSCPGIVLCLDTRYGGYDLLTFNEELTGNQIVNNTFVGTGNIGEAGIEIGVIGVEGDPTKIAATMGIIHNNTVKNNTIDGADIGIYLYVAETSTIAGNSIKNCVGKGIGIWDAFMGDNTVVYNRFYGNTDDLTVINSSGNTIGYNTFSYTGVYETNASFAYHGDFSVDGITSIPSPPADWFHIDRGLDVTNLSMGTWVNISIYYTDPALPAVEDYLGIWKHNGTWYETGWNNGKSLDMVNNVVSANVTNFGSLYIPLLQYGNLDYILITFTPGGEEIPDSRVTTNYTLLGYASAFNNTYGYIGLINGFWAVGNVDANGSTSPITGDNSTFYSGWYNGQAVWTLTYAGLRYSDQVIFNINRTCSTWNLYKGWNVITIPIDNNYSAETLGRYISHCTVVCRFNGDTQMFTTHVVGIPINNFSIQDGVGYWVYCTQESTLSMCGGPPITSVNVSIFDYGGGWNIVGWYHDYGTTAESLGQNISGAVTVVMFDARTQSFTTHVIGIPYQDFTIRRGMGVCIRTLEASYWHGEG